MSHTSFAPRLPSAATRGHVPLRLGLIACLCLAAFAGRPAGGDDKAALPPDDPFADELNPFGGRPAKPPAKQPDGPTDSAGATPQPPRQSPKLPVPFPETTAPGEPAERRPPRERARVEPRPSVRDRFDTRDEWEPTPAEKLVTEAEKLVAAGDLEGARKRLREAIATDPKLTVAHLALGVVARRLGDFEGSVAACSAGLEIDPQDPELYLRRGIAWFHLDLDGIALEDFEDAAGIAYDDPRPELWRGLTLMELDRPLEAINAYASAIRRDRTYMLAYLNRGLAYLRTEQPRKAEFDFDQAIRHDPQDVRAWFNRGVAQAQQGRFTAAGHSYREALKRDPAYEAARRNLEALAGRTDRR